MGYVSSQSKAYISLGMVKTRLSYHWLRTTAIMTTINLIIVVCMVTHHIQHQYTIICFHCAILVSYCSMIMTSFYL